MKLLFRVQTALFFLCLATPFYGQADTRLAATWQVKKYDLTVSTPAETSRETTVQAKLELKNVSGRPANSLTLRITPNAVVSKVALNGSVADFSSAEEQVGNGSLQRIALRLPPVQPGGDLTAIVDYKIALKENTGLGSISPAATQFLPMSFWYPTPNSWFFARGADYAPVQLNATVPGLTVVSSGKEVGGGVYQQDLFVQPFLIAGNWERAGTSDVTVLMPKGSGSDEQERAAELAGIAAEARTFFAARLGPAPAVPLRIVAAGRGAGFHSGGTILVDKAVFRRPKIDSATVLNITEGVAKLWIGSSIQLTGDGNGVIREGLPRYLANQFIEEKYGADVADMERTRQRIAYASVSRRDAPLNLVAPVDDFYFAAVANKGAMLWRLLARKVGETQFFDTIKTNARSGFLSLSELRAAFASQKEFLDPMLDEVTDANLLAGLPQQTGGETKIALRNTGKSDVTVDILAVTQSGERLSAPATIRGASFGEVIFKTPQKIVRVEIDPAKLYPQTDYSDDVAPRETTDSDLLLAVKRDFDRQSFAEAEKTARMILSHSPRFDDVRILLGRSLLVQNKLTEAESEFRMVLNEKLPNARSLAWAAVGIADVASKTGRAAEALRFAEEAIRADAEYGAGLAARNIRAKLEKPTGFDESVIAFFAQFDRAAISNRKAELDAMILPGEITRFTGGISGQATEWKTTVTHIDPIDADNLLVETQLAVRLLTREPETGIAVYRLTRTAAGWKLSGVDIFEVR